MRLVSKSGDRDYYDSMISFGIDPKVVYVRERKVVVFGSRGDAFEQQMYNWAQSFLSEAFSKLNSITQIGYAIGVGRRSDEGGRVYRGAIGFCGDLYPFLEVRTPVEPTTAARMLSEGEPLVDVSHFIYSLEDLVRFESRYPGHPSIKRLESHYKSFDFTPVRRMKYFEAFDVPLLAVDGRGDFYINPSLNKFAFARIKSGEQAFQEISAFISGALHAHKEMKADPISDKLKAQTKGFDDCSFRRGPTKTRK